MAPRILSRRRPEVLPALANEDLVLKGLKVASTPTVLDELPPHERRPVDELAKAIRAGANWAPQGTSSGHLTQMARARPVSAQVVAQQARASLSPSSTLTPADIELAMRAQGMDWVEPFAPGKPLVPYYGYSRRPRERDYPTGRNVTTNARAGRIPYPTLKQLVEAYDVAQICYRHAIQDLRSMRVRFEVMDGHEENAVKEVARAKEFWRKPDGKMRFRNWLCKHATDVWRYDCGTMYRQRDRAGNLKHLKIADGTLFAPMLDYFGDTPEGDAPAFQQFIQGIPWDWLKWEDLIYEPMWPHSEDPYGTAPIETILVNANTDLRLQTYFLQFFTTGQVPEAFAIAPEDQSDVSSLADWQETWNDWTYGEQSERWGLRWLPHDTELEFYKPQQFDPDVAEYVMRRTVAAFMMVPHDLGFTADVNRSTADTQMDTQFRINSLPHVAYYEDIMDDILQTDMGLPVQARFDTGREKEDRLMEAQAHAIYVGMAAESPDEVRDKILGYPINPEEKVPRFFDSQRLGPIPISYLLATAGDVDPLTGAPRPGTVEQRDLVLPGTPGPDPVSSASGLPSAGSGPAASGARPKAPRSAPRSKAPALPLEHQLAPPPESKPAATNGPNPRRSAGASSARRSDTTKEATAGIATGTGLAGGPAWADNDDEEDEKEVGKPWSDDEKEHAALDLKKWQKQSRARVAKGQAPRQFLDSSIPPGAYEYVWRRLEGADTREAVDVAFTVKATAGEHSPRSGMVSLDVPPGLIPVMEGGVPDQHVTIVFLGSDVDDDLFEEVCSYANTIAQATPGPLHGTIGGLGTFPPSESSDWLVPAFTTPEIPGIEDLRAPLERFNASQHKDFHPHMTLSYLDPEEDLPNPVPPTPVSFTHLSVHRGDDVRRFPFGGAQKGKHYDAPIVAGLALVARDTSTVLMVQRGNKDDGGDARWEWPAGHLDEGETPLDAARREWEEETDAALPPDAEQVGTWVSEDGKFQGFVFRTDSEDDVEMGTPDSDEISAITWWPIDDVDDDYVRDKVKENLDRSEPILAQAEKMLLDPQRQVKPPPKAPRPGPGGHREEIIVQYHAPKVQAALTQQVNPQQVALSAAQAAGSVALANPPAILSAPAILAAAQAFAATLHVSVAAIKLAILIMWADSWLAGAKDGRDGLDQIGTWVPSEDALDRAVEAIEWADWVPGHAPPAQRLPGYDAVKSDLGRLIKGITETTRDLIAREVADFTAGRVGPVPWTGADVQGLTDRLTRILHDPQRAMLIARTEVNRAMTDAALELIQRAGGSMFDLVAHPTACEICKGIEAENPHPMSDVSSRPPIHPQCRCSVRPVPNQEAR